VTFSVIQFVLLGVIALMLLHVISQHRRSEFGAVQLAVWLAVWIGGAVVVLFPDFSTVVANKLGVGRGADLVMYVAIPVLFYAVFRLRIRTERLSRDLTEVTRALALEVRRREDAERSAER
jgi:hypothetical protein